jgi:hypothetical protein
VEHRPEDRSDADGDDHPPDEEDFQRAGGAFVALAMSVDRGADQRDRGEEEEGHGRAA